MIPIPIPEAEFIDTVEQLDDKLLNMGKGSTGSKVGTGGMATKLTAARIATAQARYGDRQRRRLP